MIRLLTGDNKFAIDEALLALTANFAGEVETIDGSRLTLNQLPDLLMSATLFADKRLIIIHGISAQKELWSQLTDWLERLSDDTELVLVEPGADKRTKTYKWLQKNSQVTEHQQWRDYETGQAIKWLGEYARTHDLKIESELMTLMVQRAIVLSNQGKAVIDQQLLARVIEALRHSADTVSESMLDAVLPPSAYENVFELLSIAMRGDIAAVQGATKRLALSEEGHKVAALICSQAVNLSVLNSARQAGVSTSQVAKDIGVHPFALSQLEGLVKQRSNDQVKAIVDGVVAMDKAIKTGQLDVWTAVSTALIKIAALSKQAHRTPKI